jgi:hypothetical protein
MNFHIKAAKLAIRQTPSYNERYLPTYRNAAQANRFHGIEF